jgi:predicted nuclease of predicted toxin-antitoxin system
MQLLFDQNLSRHLADQLADLFPGSVHVSSMGLSSATDLEV